MLERVLVFVLCVCCCNALADSLHRFALPLFNAQGGKICDIFGRQADLVDENNFKISDIAIDMSHQANSDNFVFSVISDQAYIDPQKNEASGKGFIAISTDAFSVTGNDWNFLGNQKHFTLNKNVQVFFEKTQVENP